MIVTLVSSIVSSFFKAGPVEKICGTKGASSGNISIIGTFLEEVERSLVYGAPIEGSRLGADIVELAADEDVMALLHLRMGIRARDVVLQRRKVSANTSTDDVFVVVTSSVLEAATLACSSNRGSEEENISWSDEEDTTPTVASSSRFSCKSGGSGFRSLVSEAALDDLQDLTIDDCDEQDCQVETNPSCDVADLDGLQDTQVVADFEEGDINCGGSVHIEKYLENDISEPEGKVKKVTTIITLPGLQRVGPAASVRWERFCPGSMILANIEESDNDED